MELIVCDTNFKRLNQITEASSKIWHKKYYEPGDFEIYLPATKENRELLAVDNFIIRDDDDAIGIIENHEIVYDNNDEVDMLIVTGRFTESIYERRIIWAQTQIKTSVELGLRSLITANVISPINDYRKIDLIGLGTYKGYTEQLEAQYTGDNLAKIIKEACQANGIGQRNVYTNKKLNFELYKGVDRSYNQEVNPYVVFSDTYDNLLSSKYVKNTSNLKNAALVAGEGEGTARKVQAVGSNNTGLNRREIYVDSRNTSSNNEEITSSEYYLQLQNIGKEALSEYKISEVFTGDIEITDRYEYKKDVNLGDICTIENSEWGIYSNSRLIGVIETDDENGESIIFEFGS